MGLGLFFLLYSPAAYAGDMSGLVFLTIVWPMAAVFGLVLIGLMVFAKFGPLKREPGSGNAGFGTGMVLTAYILDLIFIAVTLGCDANYNQFETIVPSLVHIACFQLLVIPTVKLGKRVKKRALG